MTIGQELFDVAKVATVEQVKLVLEKQKVGFITTFQSLISINEVLRLAQYWDLAIAAKANSFLAATPETAQEQTEIYESYIDSVEEMAVGFGIVGKAKANVFAHELMHEFIAGAFAVAGAVLQAGMGILFPGVGSLLGAGLNTGLQHVVAHFNNGG